MVTLRDRLVDHGTLSHLRNIACIGLKVIKLFFIYKKKPSFSCCFKKSAMLLKELAPGTIARIGPVHLSLQSSQMPG